MKRSKKLGLAVVVVGLTFFLSRGARGEDEKTELQGGWKVQSALEQGEASTKPVGDRVTFNLATMVVEPKDGNKPPAMTFAADTAKQPKEIDITFVKDDKTSLVKGVYSLDGDTLKICLSRPGEPRPQKLESQPGTTEVSLVLTREDK